MDGGTIPPIFVHSYMAKLQALALPIFPETITPADRLLRLHLHLIKIKGKGALPPHRGAHRNHGVRREGLTIDREPALAPDNARAEPTRCAAFTHAAGPLRGELRPAQHAVPNPLSPQPRVQHYRQLHRSQRAPMFRDVPGFLRPPDRCGIRRAWL